MACPSVAESPRAQPRPLLDAARRTAASAGASRGSGAPSHCEQFTRVTAFRLSGPICHAATQRLCKPPDPCVVHTPSVGATVMLTAVAWAWLATSVLPKSLHSDGDKVDLASKSSPFPSTGEFLVSTGSGAGTQFLSCRKDDADFVCYSLKPGEKCGAAP